MNKYNVEVNEEVVEIKQKDNGKFITPERFRNKGTALKPAHEPIVLAQKPREGTYAENVLKHGVGGLNIDKCRVKANPDDDGVMRSRKTGKEDTVGNFGFHNEKQGKHDAPGHKGRWPANTLLTHHPDCHYTGTRKIKGDPRTGGEGTRPSGFVDTGANKGTEKPNGTLYGNENGTETIENWNCTPTCPIHLLNQQSGNRKAGGTPKKRNSDKFRNTYGDFQGHRTEKPGIGPSQGGASRFFYTAKASKKERNAGLNDSIKNDHPTLKPLTLTRYLVRLITPPNGVVLDPFAGTGTTACAATIEGFNYVLIEKRKKYAETIAPKRIEHWNNPENWDKLKDHNELPDEKELKDSSITTYLN